MTSKAAGAPQTGAAGAFGPPPPPLPLQRSLAGSKGAKSGGERLGGELEQGAGEPAADVLPWRQAYAAQRAFEQLEEEARAVPPAPLEYYLEDESLGMGPGTDYISEAAAGSSGLAPHVLHIPARIVCVEHSL